MENNDGIGNKSDEIGSNSNVMGKQVDVFNGAL